VVKTRTKVENANVQDAFEATMSRYGRSLTLRSISLTKDANGRVINRSVNNSEFTGAILRDPKTLRRYLATGQVNIGDAVLYVSRLERVYNSISVESIIVEGVGSGTFDSWEVVGVLEEFAPKGQVVFGAFRLARRNEVTLS